MDDHHRGPAALQPAAVDLLPVYDGAGAPPAVLGMMRELKMPGLDGPSAVEDGGTG